MALHPLPVDAELVIHADTDAVREFRWRPGGVEPADFEGWSARLMVGPHKGTATLVLTDGDGLTLGPDGLLRLHLTAAQADTLTGTNLVYVCDLTDPDGVPLRFLHGQVRVVRDLSPPQEEEAP